MRNKTSNLLTLIALSWAVSLTIVVAHAFLLEHGSLYEIHKYGVITPFLLQTEEATIRERDREIDKEREMIMLMMMMMVMMIMIMITTPFQEYTSIVQCFF